MGLISSEDINIRLQSPLNLMNRLRKLSELNSTNNHPSLPPKIGDVIKDIDEKLNDNSNSIKSKASAILISAMDELSSRISEVHKAKDLSVIIKDMNSVIDTQNKKDPHDVNNQPQIVIYSPRIRNENEFNIINVSE